MLYSAAVSWLINSRHILRPTAESWLVDSRYLIAYLLACKLKLPQSSVTSVREANQFSLEIPAITQHYLQYPVTATGSHNPLMTFQEIHSQSSVVVKIPSQGHNGECQYTYTQDSEPWFSVCKRKLFHLQVNKADHFVSRCLLQLYLNKAFSNY